MSMFVNFIKEKVLQLRFMPLFMYKAMYKKQLFSE